MHKGGRASPNLDLNRRGGLLPLLLPSTLKPRTREQNSFTRPKGGGAQVAPFFKLEERRTEALKVKKKTLQIN